MFGYIRPYKPELKMKEFAVYKAVYCGLCNSLGKKYGLFSRFMLNFDSTFMSLLCMSQENGCAGFEKKRCPFKPHKKCDSAVIGPAIDYWTGISVILAYYKLADDYADSGIFRKAAILPVLAAVKIPFAKAEKNNPFAAHCAREYMTAQAETERGDRCSIDRSAQPTAELMSKLLSHTAADDTHKRILKRMGYFFGRWIYIADAADDYKKDMKNGNYNPFSEMNYDAAMKNAGYMLNSCLSEISSCLALLDMRRFGGIINNVVYLGLPRMKEAVLSGLDKKNKINKYTDIYKI